MHMIPTDQPACPSCQAEHTARCLAPQRDNMPAPASESVLLSRHGLFVAQFRAGRQNSTARRAVDGARVAATPRGHSRAHLFLAHAGSEVAKTAGAYGRRRGRVLPRAGARLQAVHDRGTHWLALPGGPALSICSKTSISVERWPPRVDPRRVLAVFPLWALGCHAPQILRCTCRTVAPRTGRRLRVLLERARNRFPYRL
ncbi:hypothetical protein DAEQUDRAFT_444897 [Daedalea quercina L-15889]|uniref:Uncharacterized protein n=1 Tax=Daedalea quercina L-15889 TaxID=1314783 RepID=A0A165N780_9APHY|nr:hypothetical protein DAEQUDRAFT_444897 [Daedalea quercina L-15889]